MRSRILAVITSGKNPENREICTSTFEIYQFFTFPLFKGEYSLDSSGNDLSYFTS
jgi:hypothetical protein